MKVTGVEGMKMFEPITIKTMTLKNCIGIGPYGSHPSGPDGTPNELTVNYYERLAASGAGFIDVGIVDPIPPDFEKQVGLGCMVKIRISDDSMIEGWRRVTDVIHQYGCKCAIQLGVFGCQVGNNPSELVEDHKKFARSSMEDSAEPCYDLIEGAVPTIEELRQIIFYCGEAARRAKEAGFDCISVHNAHSDIMLGACTLDPMFNNREDEFGGTVEGRLRFTCDLIREMRRNVGEDYPISMRLNGDDLKGEFGNTLEDICRYILPELENAGLDIYDVSQGGAMYAGQGCLPVGYYPRGCWMHISSTIKKHARVPVIGVGRVTSLEMAEKILREEQVDILYFGREAYVDNDWIKKFVAGKNLPGQVRQCIGCDTRCFPCSVNYECLGMLMPDYIVPVTPLKKKKRLLVIGGGVAGMEAARVAAGRGHEVTLWEKNGRLGGNVGILATTPILSEFQNEIDYLSGQMAETGVDVRVCYEATLERVREFAPDAVILASGTREVLPKQFEGQPMVMSLMEAMERKREFRSFVDWHKKVWFSGFTGCEFALDLAESGAEVTMVGMGGDLAVWGERWFTRDRKVFLRKRLTDVNYIRRSKDTERADIRMLFRSKIEGVDAQGVHFYHNGIHKVAPYDVVIVTSPRAKNDEMFEHLQEFVPEVYKIGDCDKVGLIREAVASANQVARTI